jgi:hypothetical protein
MPCKKQNGLISLFPHHVDGEILPDPTTLRVFSFNTKGDEVEFTHQDMGWPSYTGSYERVREIFSHMGLSEEDIDFILDEVTDDNTRVLDYQALGELYHHWTLERQQIQKARGPGVYNFMFEPMEILGVDNVFLYCLKHKLKLAVA